jgi:putative phage-type endonuclease
MITLDVAQGSDEWFAAKAGLPTASNFDKLITTKGEPSEQAHLYMCDLAHEAITGKKAKGYSNANMERGIELEPEAAGFYEGVKDAEVKKVGLCYKDDQKKFGASPDRLVEEDGLLEIKCPLGKTHVSYILAGKLPTAYFQQVQGQLFVTGRKWVDFMSYYPGLKPFIIRVEPDKEFIKKLSAALDQFCYALAATIRELKEK